MPGPIPIIIAAAIAVAAVKGCKTEQVSQEKSAQQYEMEKEVFEQMKNLSDYSVKVTELAEHLSVPKDGMAVHARDGSGHLRAFFFTQQKQDKFLDFAKQYGKHIKVLAAGVKVLDFAFFMSEDTTVAAGKFFIRMHKDKESLGNAERDNAVRRAFEDAGEKW